MAVRESRPPTWTDEDHLFLAVVKQIIDTTKLTCVWKGKVILCTAIPDTSNLSVGEEVVVRKLTIMENNLGQLSSPALGVVKQVVNTTLISVVVRGRILEVSIHETSLSLTPAVGDQVLIELLPASEQWLLLGIVV